MSGNTGHGHVIPRPDGLRARCGGPGFCKVCQTERAALEMTTNTTSTASQAPAQQKSIDKPEFRRMLTEFVTRWYDHPGEESKRREIFSCIDAHTAAAVAKAREEGFEEMRQAMAESAKIMAGACRRATAAEAKLEAIRQGVEGLVGRPDNWVKRDEVLALFTTPPKEDESGLPG